MPEEIQQNNSEGAGASNTNAPETPNTQQAAEQSNTQAAESTNTTQAAESNAGEASTKQDVSTEAKAELQKEGKVSFSSIQDRLKGVETDKEAVKQKMAEAVKAQDTKVKIDTTPAVVQVQNKATQQQQQEQTLSTRKQVLKDLGVPETEWKKYQFMANEGFEAVKSHLTELKTLKSENETLKADKGRTAPIDSYSHPEGYVLDAQFKQVNTLANVAKMALDHWTQQLINIQEGKDWQDLEYDEQGNIYLGKKYTPDANSMSHLNRLYYKAMQADAQFGQQRDQFVMNFQNRHQADIASIKKLENEFFPGYDDEKSEVYKKTKGLRDQALQLIPPAWRSHPVMSLVGKVVANNKLLYDNEKAAITKLTALEKENAELKAKLAGNGQQPTKDEFVAGSGGNNQRKTLSYSEMKNRLATGLVGL